MITEKDNFLGQLDSILKFGDGEFGKLKDVIPSVSNNRSQRFL